MRASVSNIHLYEPDVRAYNSDDILKGWLVKGLH